MPKPPKELKSCGFLLFRRQPRLSFLLMQHSDRWDLPKGHVDGNETEMECALRELAEETGIPDESLAVDSDFRFTSEYTVRYKRFGNLPIKKTLVIFLATLENAPQIQLTEHQGFEWIDWDPPHRIQEKTIDPLLEAVGRFRATLGGI